MLTITSSMDVFPTKQVKKILDTSISELSQDGLYNYLPTPEFSIVSPLAEDIYTTNDIIPIEWSIDDKKSINFVDIYYSIDSTNWNVITSSFYSDVLVYNWNVSQSIGNQYSDTYQIRIDAHLYDGDLIETKNDGFFSITSQSVQLITSVSVHGIYRYLEKQLSIIDVVGQIYYPQSFISVEGAVGKPYMFVEPSLTILNINYFGTRYTGDDESNPDENQNGNVII